MVLHSKEGEVVRLRKGESNLSRVTIGLGWDAVAGKQASPDGLSDDWGEGQHDLDLDIVAFLCSDEGKVINPGHDAHGHMTLVGGDVIFFGNPEHESRTIWLTGDNLTGDGEGDDEQLIVDLNELPKNFGKIVVVVQIYKGIEKNQSFWNMRNAFIRAADRLDKEIVHFDLSSSTGFEHCRSMLFAEISRDGHDWNFNVIGKPFETDSFLDLLKQFL